MWQLLYLPGKQSALASHQPKASAAPLQDAVQMMAGLQLCYTAPLGMPLAVVQSVLCSAPLCVYYLIDVLVTGWDRAVLAPLCPVSWSPLDDLTDSDTPALCGRSQLVSSTCVF